MAAQFCQYISGQDIPGGDGADTTAPAAGRSSAATACLAIGLLLLAAAAVALCVCRRRRLAFWSQHAAGPSKLAADMEMSVDGGKHLDPPNRSSHGYGPEGPRDRAAQPTGMVEIHPNDLDDDGESSLASDGMVDVL